MLAATVIAAVLASVQTISSSSLPNYHGCATPDAMKLEFVGPSPFAIVARVVLTHLLPH